MTATPDVESLLGGTARARAAQVLSQAVPLRLAYLFGSGAKGTAGARSDIDIGIVPSDPQLSLQEELSLQGQLERVLGRDVDLVRLDRAPILVRHQVVKYGIPLWQSGPHEAARFTASTVSEYLDFEPGLTHAAKLFQRRLAEMKLGGA